MAIKLMADAVSGDVALSAEYNKVTYNVRDLDSRLTGVTGKTTGNGGISNIASRFSSIESKNNDQDSDISSLETRMGNVESKNTAQDSRLSTAESKNTDQDSAIAILDSKMGSGVGTSDDGSTNAGTVGAQLQFIRDNAGGGDLNPQPYARYDLTSQQVNAGAWVYVTFDQESNTDEHVTTRDKQTFTLAKSGKWIVSLGFTSSGSQSPGGDYKGYVSASSGGMYGPGHAPKGGAWPVVAITKVVQSDGTDTVKGGIFCPAQTTFAGGTFIEFTYVGL